MFITRLDANGPCAVDVTVHRTLAPSHPLRAGDGSLAAWQEAEAARKRRIYQAQCTNWGWSFCPSSWTAMRLGHHSPLLLSPTGRVGASGGGGRRMAGPLSRPHAGGGGPAAGEPLPPPLGGEPWARCRASFLPQSICLVVSQVPIGTTSLREPRHHPSAPARGPLRRTLGPSGPLL